jgi:hypothetical protein
MSPEYTHASYSILLQTLVKFSHDKYIGLNEQALQQVVVLYSFE